MGSIRVSGERDGQRERVGPELGALGDLGGRAKNVQAARVDATARAGAKPFALEGLKPDTIVELVFEDGVRSWSRYDQLADDLSAGRAAATRGRAGGEGTPPPPDTIDLPANLAGPPAALRSGGAAAAAATATVEAVRSFDIDLPDMLDLPGLLGGAAGTAAGPVLARRFDRWMMPEERRGLRRWAGPGPAGLVAPDGADRGGGPLLLFIHGTASSTEGSFGALRREERAGPERDEVGRDGIWTTLAQTYGERILALEHATLGESPLDNAIALLKALPGGARLHLVTHSRGGMVGELLCRAQRAGGGRPYEEEREALQRWGERRRVDYGPGLEKLDELEKLLADGKPRVERFVRVACPAAGTTLASGRLDRWLSLLTNLLDLTGLGASATYRCFKGFLLAAAKTRADPLAVPGLEAMVPGSMLTALLNRPGVQTEADLSVIAGYAEGGGALKRLAFWFSDCFYGGNHDLVVDTPAMYGGLARGPGGARVFCDYGPKVNHFGYFKNRGTARRLVAALRGEGDKADFKALSRPPKIDKMVYGRRDGAPRPRVFVLPGLMGSHLDSGAERVWIDLPALAERRFRDLDLRGGAKGGGAIEATALVEDAYGGLVEHLSASHEVLPFPYDWRRSLRDEGKRFADALGARLAEADTPVRILAHSSGGLLALAAFGLRPKLWDDFAAREGCRLLMLGAPLRGSFAVPRLLLGEERLTAYLSLLELDADEAGLLDILAAFPGLLELLPAPDGAAGAAAGAAAGDFFDPATWERLRPAAARPGGGGVRPAGLDLDSARRTRGLLDAALDAARTGPERVLHVAGAAPATPVAVDLDGAGRGGARFFANARGDGRTAWTAGVPAGAKAWWAEAEHGALASHEPAFPAYAELLETGTTSLLPSAPPAAIAGGAGPVPASPALFELPPERPPIFPDEAELAAAALGFRRRPRLPERPRARLRVVHGNLGFARWPVAVGHYDGDPILGSEGHLDRVLDHRLTRRRDLQIYPGPIGTAEILIDPAARPPGALVVGMGQVGDLTPGALRRSLAQALRRYALLARESGFAAAGEAGVTCLPIGAGEGGVGLRDSVGALLDAVAQVNRALGRDDLLAEVELVELYEDRAIQTAHAITAALREERLRGCFEFDGSVQAGTGGRRRAFPAEDPSWWRRLKIDTDEGRLRFNDLTDRASAPVQVLPDRRALAERFVRTAAAGRTEPDRSDDPGATLFQLLLPTRLKEETRGDRNLLLVLDETTAGYPWEILHEGAGDGAGPLAVRAGLLRKLSRSSSSDAPLLATGDTALVIGDPPSGSDEFPPLDEAKKEAEQVARLLADAGFTGADKPLIRPDPDGVVRALVAERWRVLHLAGHGRFDASPGQAKRVGGMVLGDGLLLTPDTIGGMRAAPEFVFINCCHLGRMDARAEGRADTDLPGLAANLASGFIGLGARAVVAAGWAVEDAAARRFAEALYGELLRGEAFGMAVRAARLEVYEDYRRTNTWGAYQCYGEPDYRLVRRRRAPGSAPPGAKGAAADARRFAHPREALVEIENVTQDAQTMAVRDPAALGERLQAAWDAVPEDWRGRSDVRASVGEACAELLLLDQAIGHYRAVLATEKATAPVRVIEQLANLRARRAAVALARGSADDRRAAAQEIARAIAMVKALLKLDAGACTVERMSLLGSCYKRLAQISAGEERTTALRRMGTCYRAAWRRTRRRGGASAYPLLNWLLAETLRGMRDPRRPAPADLERRLADAEAEAARADAAEPEFWNAVARADAMLGRHLAADGGITDPERQDAVVEAYLGPWRRGASPLKFASVVEQLDFLADALDDDAGAEPLRARSAALRAVAERLRAATGAPRDGSMALAVKTLDDVRGGGRQGAPRPAARAACTEARRGVHTAG